MNFPSKAVELAYSLLGMNYIYGYKMNYNPVTEKWIQILAKENPSYFSVNYINKARKFIGKYAIDCSGLVCYVYGLSEQNSTSLSELPNRSENWSYVNGDSVETGDLLWRSGHIAIYVGDGYLIEAKGIDYGVIKSKYVKSEWKKFIRCNWNYEHLGWNKDEVGWWYAFSHNKGDYYKDGYYKINDKWYYFDKEGYNLRYITLLTNDDGSLIAAGGERFK